MAVHIASLAKGAGRSDWPSTVFGASRACLVEIDFEWRPVLPVFMQDRVDLSVVLVSCNSETVKSQFGAVLR